MPIVLAVLLSGALWFASGGIYHAWPLAWVAPVPLLVVLPGLRPGRAALAAFAAAALGDLAFVEAYRAALAPEALVALVLITPLPYVVVALAWRAIARRTGLLVSSLAYAALVAGMEYLVSLVSPNGTFGSVAYSQADLLAVVQLASATGIWGITFLVSLVPAALAGSWRGRERRATRDAGLVIAAVPLGIVLVWGDVRLVTGLASSPSVRVGLAASDTANRPFARTPEEAVAAARGYAARAAALAERDVQFIVLPEKLTTIGPESRLGIETALANAARRYRVTIVAGLEAVGEGSPRNEAVVFAPDGRVALTYDKVHLVPGLEAGYAAGHDVGILPDAAVAAGVAICKDLDFVPLGRAYAQAGAALLLVPAWDFGLDGWLHSRMAILRSVEGGFALARVASDGRLTLSDPHGRVVAERASDAAPEVLLAAAVPVGGGGTFYSRTGDWFAWLCLAVAAACAIGAGGRRARPEGE